MIFTDGSVKNRSKENLPPTMGYGGCASVLIPIGNSFEVSIKSEPVGAVVDNVECEVAGLK